MRDWDATSDGDWEVLEPESNEVLENNGDLEEVESEWIDTESTGSSPNPHQKQEQPTQHGEAEESAEGTWAARVAAKRPRLPSGGSTNPASRPRVSSDDKKSKPKVCSTPAQTEEPAVMDEKQFAQEKYQRRIWRKSHGHTMRTKSFRVPKELSTVQLGQQGVAEWGSERPAATRLEGELRWASAEEIARKLDGKLTVHKDSEGRQALLAGFRLSTVECGPKELYLVREALHLRKTRHPKFRVAFPQQDAVPRSIFTAKTKKGVHSALIREAVQSEEY